MLSMDGNNAKLDDLRTIVEKVEQKAHVPAENPDVIALKKIVDDKIARLEQSSHKTEATRP